MTNGGVIYISARGVAPPDGASSALLKTRGAMDRLKLPTGKLWNVVALLAWAVILAFILSLLLFGVMSAAAYVVDEFYTPSLHETSAPPPGGR